MEVIKGIVDNIKPKLIIVIDSLASKSIERISSTVQLSDTGIVPGAGVGNARNEISQNTLGIPVIAMGVPMVVEAATIAAAETILICILFLILFIFEILRFIFVFSFVSIGTFCLICSVAFFCSC